MVYGVYSVNDELVAYMAPFIERTDDAAKRGFANACNSPELTMYQQSSDYALYKIGEFDDKTGVIDVINPPILICKGVDVIVPN